MAPTEPEPGMLHSVALLASGTGPGGALVLRALVEAVRFRHLGRETTVGSGSTTVRLVPTAIDATALGTRALRTGRLDAVRVSARDVVRPSLRLRELTVTATDVRLRPALVPELVTGPVEVTAVLDPGWVAARVRARSPGLAVTIDADGVVRARRHGRPGLGAAELDLRVQGRALYWEVAALRVGGRRIAARRALHTVLDRGPLRSARSGRVELAGLPPRMELTGLAVGPGRIVVHGRLASWRRPLPPARVDDVLRGALSLLDPLR